MREPPSNVKHRVTRPSVPGDVVLTPMGDGGYQLRIPPQSLLNAALDLATSKCWIFVPLMLVVGACSTSLALALLAGFVLLSLLLFLASGLTVDRDVWNLRQNYLEVTREGVSPRNWPRYASNALGVQRDARKPGWLLTIRGDQDERVLFKSASLNDVIGLSSCVAEITGWRPTLPALPPDLADKLIEDAVEWNDPTRLHFLLGYDFALPALLRMWASPAQRSLRAVLDQIPELSARIIRGVHSPDELVRASAIELLGQRRDPETAPWVRGALDDASVEVRRLAIIAAGRIRDLAAVPALCDLLLARNELSVLAAVALGAIGDPGATQALCEALRADLHEETWQVRASAADALAQTGDRAATQALCQALQDPEPQVRLSAVQALRKLADPESVEPLGLALSDDDGDVACEAAVALGGIPGPRSVSLLLGTLPFPDPAFCAAVLSALGALRDQEALIPLLLGLADSSAMVQRAAAAGLLALAEIAGTAPLEFRGLISPLDRTARASLGDRELRRTCRRAIARIEEQTAGVKDLPLPSSPMEVALDNLPRVAASSGSTEPVIQRVSGNDV